MSLFPLLTSLVNLESFTVTGYKDPTEEHSLEDPFTTMRLPPLRSLKLRSCVWETITLGRMLCALPHLATLCLDQTAIVGGEEDEWGSIDPAVREDLVSRITATRLETLTWSCGMSWQRPDQLLMSSPLCRRLRRLCLRTDHGLHSGQKLVPAYLLLRTAGPSLESFALMVTTQDPSGQALDGPDFSLNTNLSSFHLGVIMFPNTGSWADQPTSVLGHLQASPAMRSLRRLDIYLVPHGFVPETDYLRPRDASLGGLLASMLHGHSRLIVTFYVRSTTISAAELVRCVLTAYLVRCAPGLMCTTESRMRLRFVHDLVGQDRGAGQRGLVWMPCWDDVGTPRYVGLLPALDRRSR